MKELKVTTKVTAAYYCCCLLEQSLTVVITTGGLIMTELSMEQQVYVGVFSEENETRLSNLPANTGRLGLNTAPEASPTSGNTVPRFPTRTPLLMLIRLIS